MRRGLWVVTAGLACSLPAFEVESEHVRVAADPGLVMCGGTMAHMDAFVVRVAEMFGVEPPTGADKIEFSWLGREEFAARSGCSADALGCVRRRLSRSVVFSEQMPLNHELVHVLSRPWNRAPFFVEGLAVALEGLGDRVEPVGWLGWPDVRSNLEARTSQAVDYAVAGGFVGHLIEEFGVEAVLRVMGRLSRETSTAQVDAALRAELGTTLDVSIAEFEATLLECSERRTAMLLECEAPEIEWDGVMFAEYRTLACEQEDVVGPYTGFTAAVFRTIAVREAGVYEVRAIADDERLAVALASCEPCGPRGHVRARGGTGAFTLDAGLYSVRVIGAGEGDVEVGWSIRRVD